MKISTSPVGGIFLSLLVLTHQYILEHLSEIIHNILCINNILVSPLNNSMVPHQDLEEVVQSKEINYTIQVVLVNSHTHNSHL